MQQRMLSNLLAISKSAPHFPWCNGQTYEYMSWVLVFQVCLPLYVSLSPRGGSDRAVSHAVYCPDPLCFLVILVYASSVFFHCDLHCLRSDQEPPCLPALCPFRLDQFLSSALPHSLASPACLPASSHRQLPDNHSHSLHWLHCPPPGPFVSTEFAATL